MSENDIVKKTTWQVPTPCDILSQLIVGSNGAWLGCGMKCEMDQYSSHTDVVTVAPWSAWSYTWRQYTSIVYRVVRGGE